ncbi:aromatase/cyclase [Streptomyces sp. NRRL F-5630]|uniref:aromatase/cyclase n=1 Tax=Streptomyces sp. NRRL F-5630 TaxID=1463864 RepID=UPI0004C998AE|nr:aromatase/cyclase [Streptomyces sp. NRRL F-5630]
MPNTQQYSVRDEVLVAAPAEQVRSLVEDVTGWTQLHAPAVHAEILSDTGDEQLVRHWAVTGRDSVRTWTARRTRAADSSRISFVHEEAESPFASLGGAWTFQEQDGKTLVEMRHDFTLAKGEEGLADEVSTRLRTGARDYLRTLGHAAEKRGALNRLIISFTDSLFVAGDIKDAYDYLWEADKWEERIPHIAKLDLEEPAPGVQFFDMLTSTPDGSSHRTRSVRVTVEPDIIVYKQTELPALLDGHTGHWRFTQTPEGVIAEARHTATIKPSALHILGEGTTVLDARKYLRRVLSANSVSNLRLAKAYAEERAGV